MNTAGKNLWVIAVLGCLGLLLGFATAWAQAPDPDLNNDGVVNILDISLVGSCFGLDLSTHPQCQVADTDGDGDVDMDDLNVVVAGFGQSVPVLTITAPADGSVVTSSPITVSGTLVNDTTTVQVNGVPAVVESGSFTATVNVVEGLNVLTIVATNTAGNASSPTLNVTLDTTSPVVTITDPANLSVFSTDPMSVSGTVDEEGATVEVNGLAATVNGQTWSAVGVPLSEGNNTLTAVAEDAVGHIGTASIQVTLDTTAPQVTINSPGDDFVTNSASITVAGMINDIVVGTVNGDQAQVTVNGIPAQVANRSFLVAAVPLSPGPNPIVAVGTDRAGNTASTSITVTFAEIVGAPQITLVSGNNQTAPISAPLPLPLGVELMDGAGDPAPGETVIFKVTENNGTLRNSPEEVRALAVQTGADGRAQVHWTLGTRSGAGNNMVEAIAVGFSGMAIFTATALPAAPDKINVDAGNNQTGVVGKSLPSPFVAVVTDAGHNRLANVPVTFTVIQGVGNFNGQSTFIVNTDSDGRAQAVLTLGPEEGVDNNVVEADFAGNLGFSATFVAAGMTAGDPADTTISGVVLDNSNIPIPGVTMSIEGTALSTQTDAEGQFVLQPAPVGHVKLHADGSTAERPGTWPSLEFDLVTVPGQDNTIGMPIFLLPLDLLNGLFVDETTGGTLTLPEVPGFSLTIAPGSATFPDGSTSGVVSVTVVHADKIPMVPNFGQQPRFIVTIQPAGVLFDPPAPITIPNLDGLAPGEVTELYSFDHDLGQFVSIGTGTVSEDGTVVASDPGVGIIKGGWHCGGNPQQSGGGQNAHVQITSTKPVMLGKDKTEIITASGGPTPGTYSWTSSDPSIIEIQSPTSGSNVTSITIKGKAVGKVTITVRYTCQNGAFAEDTVEVRVMTKDIVVIAWVDGNVISLPSGASSSLVSNLNSTILCPFLLANWLIGLRTFLNTDIDRQYANAFLLKNSPNSKPGSVIDPDAVEAGGDFRLFNRFKVFLEVQNGRITGTPEFLQMRAIVGKTPDPCGILPAVSGESHPSNGVKRVTTSSMGVFELNEGRIGSLGQRVDTTLNDPGGTVGETTSWIWSVIKFDVQGDPASLDNQIFPTYFVYEDGRLVRQFSQSGAEAFISLDQTSQRLPAQIP